MKPYTTWTPARSICRDQLMLLRFVEAGLQLDQRRDVLAVLGGLHQRLDDRAVAAGAVERLLDGQHVGVFGRALDEVDDRVERIERMVQQHVAVGDLGEQVVASPHAQRLPRRERRVAQRVLARHAVQLV